MHEYQEHCHTQQDYTAQKRTEQKASRLANDGHPRIAQNEQARKKNKCPSLLQMKELRILSVKRHTQQNAKPRTENRVRHKLKQDT
jgi:hypothetical protein